MLQKRGAWSRPPYLARNMTTPGMVFMSWLKTVCIVSLCLWMSTITVTRVHIGYTAYRAAEAMHEKEKYLLEKCNEPEFFYNMQYHTDLCAEVQENARSSPVLKAINTMAINTYMCGTHPCSEVIRAIASAIGWQILTALTVAAFVLINMAFFTMRNVSAWRMHTRENALRDRHGRHGLAYYPEYVHDLQVPAGGSHGIAGWLGNSSSTRLTIEDIGDDNGEANETTVLKNGVLTGAFANMRVRNQGGEVGMLRGV